MSEKKKVNKNGTPMYWNMMGYDRLETALIKLEKSAEYGDWFNEKQKIIPVPLTYEEIIAVVLACQNRLDYTKDKIKEEYGVEMGFSQED